MPDAATLADQFRSIVDDVTKMAAEDRKSLQDQLNALMNQQTEIEKEIAELEQHIASIDKDVAVGLSRAARDAGVRVKLVGGKNGKDAKQKTPRKRLSETDVKKVLDVIPDGEDDALTIGKITKAIGASDSTLVAAAIKQLLKDRAITSVGERRGKRYFKPGKKLKQVKKSKN